MRYTIGRIGREELVLHCGYDGMESDLVFASGACLDDDPLMEKQKDILDGIVGMAARIVNLENQLAKAQDKLRNRTNRILSLHRANLQRKTMLRKKIAGLESQVNSHFKSLHTIALLACRCTGDKPCQCCTDSGREASTIALNEIRVYGFHY